MILIAKYLNLKEESVYLNIRGERSVIQTINHLKHFITPYKYYKSH